ncbi:DUF3421 domain-containing protein [Pseudooceanicola nanhaiensis]|uniref:DUF3421 domain-containing protein n=1 Tax=Pseudooceanicola nanhaiensis TaxID=375761 RepID=UPI001CD5CA1A|nr:DUF3421 domain-containing protein [Pseudooceanicola nanhaiensis]MCA0920725.1 DUF3421 domain-containing protein [Pseudooceanicola nanhaiensis]
MHFTKTLAALACLLSAGTAQADPFSNGPGQGGSIPRGAFEAGWEANGAWLYSCVTEHNGGWHPGKIRPGFSGCNFGYGGRELTASHYRVLTGTYNWLNMSNTPGSIPGAAVPIGYEADGRTLYVCRGEYKGGWHPGKIRAGFSGCSIGYGGREIEVKSYDVLIP